MEEILAANVGEFAAPEGAANEGEGARSPAAEEAAAVEGVTMEQGAEAGKGWTRKVARRIKEEREKARDELMTELFGSVEGCEEYRRQRQLDETVAADREEAGLLAELALAADPQLGDCYLELADQVQELAGEYGMDLESAFLVTLRQKLPELLQAERQKGEQQLLAKLQQNAVTPGSLADGAGREAGLFALSDREFADMVARVKRGELNKI